MVHSPEPWGCHDKGTETPTICKERDDGTCHEIAELTGCQGMGREELIANGERIVACVNACAGIESDDLKIIQKMAAAERAGKQFNHILNNRPLTAQDIEWYVSIVLGVTIKAELT